MRIRRAPITIVLAISFVVVLLSWLVPPILVLTGIPTEHRLPTYRRELSGAQHLGRQWMRDEYGIPGYRVYTFVHDYVGYPPSRSLRRPPNWVERVFAKVAGPGVHHVWVGTAGWPLPLAHWYVSESSAGSVTRGALFGQTWWVPRGSPQYLRVGIPLIPCVGNILIESCVSACLLTFVLWGCRSIRRVAGGWHRFPSPCGLRGCERPTH